MLCRHAYFTHLLLRAIVVASPAHIEAACSSLGKGGKFEQLCVQKKAGGCSQRLLCFVQVTT